MATNVFEGQSVRLRAVEPEDWEALYHWYQQSDLLQRIDAIPFPRSQARMRSRTAELAQDLGADDNFHFQIETLGGDLVGWLLIHHADPRMGTFMYGVAISEEQRGHGYAVEAVVVALRYYFQERRYQKVNAETFEYNAASLALQERLGFTQEGRLRRMQYSGGRYHDLLQFGMTHEEFDQRHGGPSADESSSTSQ
jgi:RimJ/RimL family protein N-acetyltransferase